MWLKAITFLVNSVTPQHYLRTQSYPLRHHYSFIFKCLRRNYHRLWSIWYYAKRLTEDLYEPYVQKRTCKQEYAGTFCISRTVLLGNNLHADEQFYRAREMDGQGIMMKQQIGILEAPRVNCQLNNCFFQLSRFSTTITLVILSISGNGLIWDNS